MNRIACHGAGRSHPILSPTDQREALVFISQDGSICIEQAPSEAASDGYPDLIELSPEFALRLATELLRLRMRRGAAA